MARLEQRLEQKQALQPRQIMQATILQMNILNLEERILEELESNPALEELEETPEAEEEQKDENEMDWEQDYEYEAPNIYEKKEWKDMPIPHKKDFVDLLEEQLNFCNLNDTERVVAEEMIYNLDENGYLSVELDIISDRFEMDPDEVLKILKKVQTLEPKGIAARDLKECLLLQIDKITHPLAHECLTHYFDEIANHRYEGLSEKAGCSDAELKEVLDLISRLNPKPGGGSLNTENVTVIPELIIYERDNTWVIAVNDSWLPEVQISQEYVDLLAGELDKKSKSFIKDKMDSAQWFVEAVSERRKTLTNVMKEIIKRQPDFFEGNLTKLTPMKLQDIADELKMDISTISRSTRGKYVDSPYGIFELKSFFTEGMVTSDGEEISTMQIKMLLKELLENEKKQTPYTDEKLKDLLNGQGYPLARRTVAKYREQLQIPVARLRREM